MPGSLMRLLRLVLKEQRELLRDRRTLLTLFLMPVLFYPLVSMIMNQVLLTQAGKKIPITYTFGFRTNEDADFVSNLLVLAGRWEATNRPNESKDTHSARLEAKIDREEELYKLLRAGAIDALVTLPKNRPLQLDPHDPVAIDLEIIGVEGRAGSSEAVVQLKTELERASQRLLANRLKTLKVPQRASPIVMMDRRIKVNTTGENSTLAAVLPMILILMTITGAVYPAIDLTAGERERGTLEMLMAAPVPRQLLLVAKYIAVLTVALMTAGVNLIAMTVTLLVSNLGSAFFPNEGITFRTILGVAAALVLFSMLFSAILLAISCFARSFKEAQAYLIPVMLFALTPAIMSLFPWMELNRTTAGVPLLNLVLWARDFQRGIHSIDITLFVVITTICYAAASLLLASRLFGSEGVLYGGAGSVRQMFGTSRRSLQPTPVLGLFVVALVLPLYLISLGAVGRLLENNTIGQLLSNAIAISMIFIFVPILACRFFDFRTSLSLALHRPSVWYFVAALFWGLSVWPFALAINHPFQQQFDSHNTDPAIQEARQRQFEQLVELATLPRLIIIALTPAISEELFFRGFLYTALASRFSALPSILMTAVVFSLFHGVSIVGLTPDRLPSSFLLGMFLGVIRAASHSVWPGMILHFCNNALVAISIDLAADQPQWLRELAVLGEISPTIAGFAFAGLLAGAALILLVNSWAAKSEKPALS